MSQPTSTAPPERLGMAGSGAVACGLAAAAALHGMTVKLWARSSGSADRARALLEADWSRADDSSAGERVEIVEHLADLGDVTVVVEAVREEESVKREVFSTLAKAAGPQTLFATTTSSLSVKTLA